MYCFLLTIPGNFLRRFSREGPTLSLQRENIFCTAYTMRTIQELVAQTDHARKMPTWSKRMSILTNFFPPPRFDRYMYIILSSMRMDFTAANKLTCGLLGLTMYILYDSGSFEPLRSQSYNGIEEGIIFHRFLHYGMNPL